MKSKVFAALLACLISAPTVAESKENTPALRELVTCSPSKNITKLIAKVQEMDVEKRDVVDSILEEMGGDGLKIVGGAYNLMPAPKPKTLAKFAQCADDEEDENKEE